MQDDRSRDSWGVAALEAVSFFAGISVGFCLPLRFGLPGLGAAVAMGLIGYWRWRLTVFAVGTLVGIGLVVAMVAVLINIHNDR